MPVGTFHWFSQRQLDRDELVTVGCAGFMGKADQTCSGIEDEVVLASAGDDIYPQLRHPVVCGCSMRSPEDRFLFGRREA